MPYKSEKIRIDNTIYDRRRKLTEEQKEEIREIYSKGVCGTRPLARQFGVSKTTIQIIYLSSSYLTPLTYTIHSSIKTYKGKYLHEVMLHVCSNI